MLSRFQQYIAENRLASVDSRLVLAVSGGVDSMVMTDLFIKSGFAVVIAHCNFTLRGEESDSEQQMVADFAKKHNIPFYTISFDTVAYAREQKISIELAARELRYSWFERLRLAIKFDFIAVAHNVNDNAETVLLNMARGTGLTGLTGIKSQNGKIIRPLLFATRSEIEQYAHENSILFCNDSSNSETIYSRNRIRHHVIPILNSVNSAAVLNIAAMSKRLAEVDRLLSEIIEHIRTEVQCGGCGSFDEQYSIESLRQFADNNTIIYELFKRFGITGANIKQFLSLLDGQSGRQMTTQTHRIVCDREKLIITPINSYKETTMVFDSVESINESGLLTAQVVSVDDSFTISTDRDSAYFDYDKISFPMVLRNWRDGDSFIPFGMRGRKKVSDYLIDKKVAITDKEKTLVMVSGGEIIWVVGYRIAETPKIKSSTSSCLLLSLKSLS